MEDMEATRRESVKREVSSFILDNFFSGEEAPALRDEASFLQTGVLDSRGTLELVSFVEFRYGFSVTDSEIVPQNLDSLNNIAGFVCQNAAWEASRVVG